MTTIGDSFSIVAILLGMGLTLWSLILTFSLMFIRRAQAAREMGEARPWRSFGIGLLMTALPGLFAFVLTQSPNQGAKLLGITLILLLGAMALVGASGISMLIAGRMRALDPELTHYGSMARGSMILVFGTFFPLLGWFLVGPVLFIVSLGLGTQTLLARERSHATAPTV